jgi:hypothetical protein
VGSAKIVTGPARPWHDRAGFEHDAAPPTRPGQRDRAGGGHHDRHRRVHHERFPAGRPEISVGRASGVGDWRRHRHARCVELRGAGAAVARVRRGIPLPLAHAASGGGICGGMDFVRGRLRRAAGCLGVCLWRIYPRLVARCRSQAARHRADPALHCAARSARGTWGAGAEPWRGAELDRDARPDPAGGTPDGSGGPPAIGHRPAGDLWRVVDVGFLQCAIPTGTCRVRSSSGPWQ